ncbi:class I SAM-dependent methyltransferase [Candidatus Roizmanbacteria bacterium]|nr:class I SAM-dependent methyltransferase [Candidatus Roizmanbacteria bacterium]
MIYLFIYFLVIALELIFAISAFLYISSLIFSSLMGAPYVPTKNDEIQAILKEADLKKDHLFLELGCGDGRVVRTAVKHYHVRGVGVDINPLLVGLARFKARKIQSHLEFRTSHLMDTGIRNFDVIYLFLMPDLLQKLGSKLKAETKKGTLIISHGFRLEGFEKNLYKTLMRNPFPTYYYRLN